MFNPVRFYRSVLIPVETLIARCKPTNNQGVASPTLITVQTTIRSYVKPTCELCQSDKTENELKHNTYYEKYKAKLQDLAKSAPGEYKTNLEKISQVKQQATTDHRKDLSEPPPSITKSPKGGVMSWPPKELNDVIKLDKIKDKTPVEIEQIWIEHFVKRDCVFAVLKEPYAKFDEFLKRSKEHPAFIYPVPRQDGYEFYLSGIKGTEVYFTPLINYQKHKENAVPCLSLKHFTEFQQEKGIVLMAGIYDEQHLNKQDALNLVRQMSQYYGNRTPEHFRLVMLFNIDPQKFDYSTLISEYKMMQTLVESELPI